MTMKQSAKLDKHIAIERLRETFMAGDTVNTVLRHVSRSGMSRSISVLDKDNSDISYLVARALGNTVDQKNGGVKVGGCGMDMGFHLVYELSYVLFPNGFGCTGKDNETRTYCPSCDHSNGYRDYTPNGGILSGMPQADSIRTHWHTDGGYALRQRWI
jgi:hypothetical protein